MTTTRNPSTFRRVRGFSLIEVLLAIFILGVGVISIAALFPAGIAQQRLSTDEVIGPIVANNAFAIISNKVKPDYFGTMESFAPNYSSGTIPGDWPWLRPGMLVVDDAATGGFDERGVLDVFSNGFPGPLEATEFGPPTFPSGFPNSTPVLYGIPYNQAKFGNTPPRIVITQGDRYFPMRSQTYPTVSLDPARPQYVWDCMFRRFDGKIFVAIFVYRVTMPAGGPAIGYKVAPNAANPQVPPLPISLDLTNAANADVCSGGAWWVGGADHSIGGSVAAAADNAIIKGLVGGTPYNPANARHVWQEPRQWLLDQNNNVHRVLSQARKNSDPAQYLEVELVRPVAPVPKWNAAPPTGSPYFYGAQPATNPPTPAGFAYPNVVTNIWYMPLIDANGMTLTPVYATVKEL